MISEIFIDRPRLSIVISVVITLAGAHRHDADPGRPVPRHRPAPGPGDRAYPGASAAVVESTVAQPIESQVNGVDNMLYMKSTSGNDGSYTLTVTFALGTDPDLNTVNVQNRVNLAEPQLPEEVRARVTVQKKSSPCSRSCTMHSPNGSYDALFLSNYATINVIDTPQARAGRRRRLAVRPARLQHADLARLRPPDRASGSRPTDVTRPSRRQNVQAAVGRIGAQPHARPAVPDHPPDQGPAVERRGVRAASSCAPIRTARRCG